MARFYTIGHSSRSIEEFRSTLQAHGADVVADVRRFPGSERNPQFDADALADSLAERGIGYRHFEALGGRRSSPAADSPNQAWENRSFRSYADYARTAAFQTGLDELVELGRERTPAVTCAEYVYWRCHRRIIADWLVARGHDVVNVYDADRADEHELTRFAEVRDGDVVYPTSDDS